MKNEEMKKMAGEENRPDEEEKDEEATEEEEKSCAKKSEGDEISEDDLEKSLQKLTDFVEVGDGQSRKDALLEKAGAGELTKSENDELHAILGGGEAPVVEDTLSDEIEKSMTPDEEMQKAIDVSKYLDDQHAMVTQSMGKMAGHIEKSDARQHEFNVLLAKGLADMGKLVKAVSDSIEVIGGQPVRAPKSQRVAATPLNKSFANQGPTEGSLSKSEILDTMSEMVRKSFENGGEGMVNGVNMLNESAKYEATGMINPKVMGMVQQEKSTAH